MTLSIPTPRPAPAAYTYDRTIDVRWDVPGQPGEQRRLVVSHDSTAKAYRAFVGEVHQGTGEAYRGNVGLFRGDTIVEQPAGRYSTKAHQAFAAQVLADLPQLLQSTNEYAVALFAPVAEAPQAEDVEDLDRCADGCVCTPEERAEQGEDPALAIGRAYDPKLPHLVVPTCTCGERLMPGFSAESVARDVAARHLAEKHADALDRYTAVLTGDLSVLQPDFLAAADWHSFTT